MGEAWSWPCGEREERRAPVKTGKAPVPRKASESPDLSFLQTSDPYKITFVPSDSLETFFSEVCLEKHIQDFFPYFVFQSPLDMRTAVVLLMRQDFCANRCASSLRFKVQQCTFPGLQEEISSKHLSVLFNAFDREGKQEIIGAVTYEEGIKVIHGVRSPAKSAYTLSILEIKEPLTTECLSNILATQNRMGNAFRFAVIVRGQKFVVFEKGVSDGCEYFVAQFDLTMRVESLKGLPQTIYVQEREFSFEGPITDPTTKTMFLVFKSRE